MEKFLELKEEALKKIKTADHILTQSYPLVKDTKLLLGVMDNLFLGMTNAMASLLYYERSSKNIPPFQDNFDSKFNMFRSKLVDKHNIKKSHIELLEEIKDIITEHRKSPVEFTRKDCFVICSDNYDMRTISLQNINKYLSGAKSFLNEISRLVN